MTSTLYHYFSCHPTMCSMIYNIDHSQLSQKNKTSETKGNPRTPYCRKASIRIVKKVMIYSYSNGQLQGWGAIPIGVRVPMQGLARNEYGPIYTTTTLAFTSHPRVFEALRLSLFSLQPSSSAHQRNSHSPACHSKRALQQASALLSE